MRYRCPSVSTVSDVSSTRSYDSLATVMSAGRSPRRLPTVVEDYVPVAGPSTARSAAQRPARVEPKPVKKLDKGKGKMRSHSKMDAGDKERLRMAFKKKEIKEVKAAPKLTSTEWAFVYVGNLSSSVTDEQVGDFFKQCGPIRRLQIRASGGVCVPTANLKGGFFGFGGVTPGVHYATVEFEQSASARKAKELSGQELAGREIIVTFNPGDLPETCDSLKSLIVERDPHLVKRALWKEKFGQLKRLTIQRTERIPDGEAGGPATFVSSVAMRLGLYAAGGTAGEAHHDQNGARHPPAKPASFLPKIIF